MQEWYETLQKVEALVTDLEMGGILQMTNMFGIYKWSLSLNQL